MTDRQKGATESAIEQLSRAANGYRTRHLVDVDLSASRRRRLSDWPGIVWDGVAEHAYWAGRTIMDRGRGDHNWTLGRVRRTWLIGKTLAMLAAGGLCWLDRDDTSRYDGWAYDAVQIAQGPALKGFHPDYGETGNFDYLAIAYRGWAIRTGTDGWP